VADADETILIVGAGLAGSRCAEALRAGGHRGRIRIAGEEPETPYERPALSKGFLAGHQTEKSLRLRGPSHWYDAGIELDTSTRIKSVDPEGAAVTASGSTLEWDALVLATGAKPRHLTGDDRAGVHHLRTLADAATLRRDLVAGHHLVIVGAGFIGLEVASTARTLGLNVTVVTPDAVPLRRIAGKEVGSLIADRACAAGVRLLTGESVSSLSGGADGRIASVSLASGRELRCDVALVAIGVRPASELAHGLVSIATDGGIETDNIGRSSCNRIYACGDVASSWRPWLAKFQGSGHWTSAADGARAVATAILGAPAPPSQIPFAWSDAFDVRVQHVGGPPPIGATLELDASAGDFEACFRIGGELRCAIVGNRPRRMLELRREITSSWSRGPR
jgi:3-phenylpropionate/trans-cinnamate dioxygenase ferredoxin reductase subunit